MWRGCTPGTRRIYSALAEQCRRLDALGIGYEIVPGVPAFAAAAAALGRELTVPGVAQTVTLTRVATLSTPMPPGEDLHTPGRSGCHAGAASGRRADRRDRPAAAGRRLPARNPMCGSRFRELAAGDRATMHAGGYRRADARRRAITTTAVIVVGDVLAAEGFSDSYLYSAGAPGTAALMRVLLLGGTAEARALAARLHPRVDVSARWRAGCPTPRCRWARSASAGSAASTGCGDGCATTVDAVVDATHPFAATITAPRRRRSAPNWGCRMWCWPARPGRPVTPSSSAPTRKPRKPLPTTLFADLSDHRPLRHRGFRRQSTRGF